MNTRSRCHRGPPTTTTLLLRNTQIMAIPSQSIRRCAFHDNKQDNLPFDILLKELTLHTRGSNVVDRGSEDDICLKKASIDIPPPTETIVINAADTNFVTPTNDL